MTKDEHRKLAFARRARADRTHLDQATRHLLLAVRSAKGREVAGYWPIRTEIDPRPAMEALADTHGLCLPVVVGAGLPLVFRRWVPGAEMVDGAFGTSWPAADQEVIPDVLIVPLAAYSSKGYRLGYGGGFYDRTLEMLRARGKVTAIGFAYAIQEEDEIPVEDTDQPLDMVATELGVMLPR